MVRIDEMQVVIPVVMSGVVGVLKLERTPRDGVLREVRERMALSVLVPPTSTPILYILRIGRQSFCLSLGVFLRWVLYVGSRDGTLF